MRALKLVWMKSPVGSRRTNKDLDRRVRPGLEVSRARPALRVRRGIKGSRAPRDQRVRRATPVLKGPPDPRVTTVLKDLPDRWVRRESGATLGRKVRVDRRAIQELQVPLGRKEIRVPKATQARKVHRDLPARRAYLALKARRESLGLRARPGREARREILHRKVLLDHRDRSPVLGQR